jgi:hypothetical protein
MAEEGREPDTAWVERADEDRRGRLGRGLGAALGGLSLVGGLTWMLLNLHGPQPVVDLAVGVVLALGGLVLLMPHRTRLPGRRTTLVAAVAGVVGAGAGLIGKAEHLCCMYTYIVERGFPFRWLTRGGIADDPATARTLAAGDGWHVDVAALAVERGRLGVRRDFDLRGDASRPAQPVSPFHPGTAGDEGILGAWKRTRVPACGRPSGPCYGCSWAGAPWPSGC